MVTLLRGCGRAHRLFKMIYDQLTPVINILALTRRCPGTHKHRQIVFSVYCENDFEFTVENAHTLPVVAMIYSHGSFKIVYLQYAEGRRSVTKALYAEYYGTRWDPQNLIEEKPLQGLGLGDEVYERRCYCVLYIGEQLR